MSVRVTSAQGQKGPIHSVGLPLSNILQKFFYVQQWWPGHHECSCAYSFSLARHSEGGGMNSVGKQTRKEGRGLWDVQTAHGSSRPGFYATFYVVCDDLWILMSLLTQKYELGLVIKLFTSSLQFFLNTEARNFVIKTQNIHVQTVVQSHGFCSANTSSSCLAKVLHLISFSFFCCNPVYCSKECQ